MTQLLCNGCGAVLEVHEDAQATTCRYCRSRTEISRSEKSASAVETARLKNEVKALRLRRALDDLDLAWERYLEKTLAPAANGRWREPSQGDVTLKTALFVIPGILALLAGIIRLDPVMALLPGLPMLAIGWYFWREGSACFNEYESAKSKYESRHLSLQQEMTGLR